MSTSNEARLLNERIKHLSEKTLLPHQRIRTRLGFQRILARLACAEEWVLKGGFSLDVRLGLRARSTRDLDLLHSGANMADGLLIQETLEDVLGGDLDDGFTFRTAPPRTIRLAESKSSAWRIGIHSFYFGSPFAALTIDVVEQDEKSASHIELLTVEPDLIGQPFNIPAIDVELHAAEKFHAYAMLYARERPSSRVKDLVDLIILDELGHLRLPELGKALREVFSKRDGAKPPESLPKPPLSWEQTYLALSKETGLSVVDALEAWATISVLYQRALDQTSTSTKPSD